LRSKYERRDCDLFREEDVAPHKTPQATEICFNQICNPFPVRPPKLGASGSLQGQLMEAVNGYQNARDEEVPEIDIDASDDEMADVGDEEVEF
jgi:hypothetical protein